MKRENQLQNIYAHRNGMYTLAAYSHVHGGSKYPQEPFELSSEPEETPEEKERKLKEAEIEKMKRYLNSFIPSVKRVI